MIKLYDAGVYVLNGTEIIIDSPTAFDAVKAKTGSQITIQQAKAATMAYSILEKHNTSDDINKLKVKFDALTSHDITYVGIVQTARASGLEKFPVPFVLTNCHNSLCAVGGTINEDDHLFGLSAAEKYGGIFVPAHLAVIHQYMREMMSGCGKMILGSDSHTRYGALGTMAIGEGGPELVKQLLNKTYDIDYPRTVAIYLTGEPQHGVGPQDVALAIIGAVFKNGYVKNSVMEFIGDGIGKLSVDFRNGIDVMTTETTCLSTIWETDEKVKEYYKIHGREAAYQRLSPGELAYYDGLVYVDLSLIKPMIALPFHPSNVYPIAELNDNLEDILAEVEAEGTKAIGVPGVKLTLRNKISNGKLYVEQGIIAGCSGGTFENIYEAADILETGKVGVGAFSLSVYPQSNPVYHSLLKNGQLARLVESGAVIKSAFCGPCFGAGDTPGNNGLSIRHVTRNFLNREGSKPGNGQIASVALMDARSIAATAANGGVLTSAADVEWRHNPNNKYEFNKNIYQNRCYSGFGNPKPETQLVFGPNIADWPPMTALTDHILLKVASILLDPVTTTDELIPSGETSSYRSNPQKMAEFTLSRKDPAYVGRAREAQAMEQERLNGKIPATLSEVYDKIKAIDGFTGIDEKDVAIGSVIYAVKPGDGSAREQAASCQKVLGGLANIAQEYATKRYRSNLINWGIIPFISPEKPQYSIGDYIFVPNIRECIINKKRSFDAYIISDKVTKFTLEIQALTDDEIKILTAGCLINYYAN